MRRFATLGASIWLIFLGILVIVEFILVLVTKNPAARALYLSGLIFFVIFGLIYYLAFRFLGGWNISTWEGTDSGKKTLLFIIGLPGLIVGAIVLIFVIWFWLTDDTDRVGYSLPKKKKKTIDLATPSTSVEAGQEGN